LKEEQREEEKKKKKKKENLFFKPKIFSSLDSCLSISIMYRTGVRRLLFQVTRHEGDVSKAGGSLSRRERAAENLWIEEEVNDFSFLFFSFYHFVSFSFFSFSL